jgi:hypothetical protein
MAVFDDEQLGSVQWAWLRLRHGTSQMPKAVRLITPVRISGFNRRSSRLVLVRAYGRTSGRAALKEGNASFGWQGRSFVGGTVL